MCNRLLEHPDHLHLVGPGFGCSSGCTRQVCPCGRLRVDGIVLAEPSSDRSIRSVHFDDGETRIQKLAGQTGPIGACTFNRVDGVGSKLLAPEDQIVVSLASGGDAVLSKPAAIGGQCDGNVNVFVRGRRSRRQVLGPCRPVPRLVMPSLLDGGGEGAISWEAGQDCVALGLPRSGWGL